ncbi:MAG: toll/interleukin-1 receptor domain-containing protein [Eggerthellaceae bacterium]|nr:toll/interleukin-1 receptor domain-containing protein [Eggerthellaceae bacterium]
MHDVFISYSHEDVQVADAVCHKLESEGIRCWYAPRNIAPGATWADAIIEAIEGCEVMVLVFTDYSNASNQVHRELDTAVSLGKAIIPFRSTDTLPTGTMRYYLSTLHWLDAFDAPLEQGVTTLAERVKGLLGKSEEEPAASPASQDEKASGQVAPAAVSDAQPSKEDTPSSPSVGGKKTALIIGAIVAVLTIAVIAFGVMGVSQNGQQAQQSQTAQTADEGSSQSAADDQAKTTSSGSAQTATSNGASSAASAVAPTTPALTPEAPEGTTEMAINLLPAKIFDSDDYSVTLTSMKNDRYGARIPYDYRNKSKTEEYGFTCLNDWQLNGRAVRCSVGNNIHGSGQVVSDFGFFDKETDERLYEDIESFGGTVVMIDSKGNELERVYLSYTG